MAIPIRKALIHLAIPLLVGLGPIAGAADQSINNIADITLADGLSTKSTWDIMLIQGAGKGDLIEVKSDNGKGVKLKPGERLALTPNRTHHVTFSPNVGNDGSRFEVRFTNLIQANGRLVERSVDYRVVKPVSTLLTAKSSRTLKWTRISQHLSDMPNQALEIQQETVVDKSRVIIQGSNVTISGDLP